MAIRSDEYLAILQYSWSVNLKEVREISKKLGAKDSATLETLFILCSEVRETLNENFEMQTKITDLQSRITELEDELEDVYEDANL